MSDDVTVKVLESEVSRLEKEVTELRAALARPVNVTVTAPPPPWQPPDPNISSALGALNLINLTLSNLVTAIQQKGTP